MLINVKKRLLRFSGTLPPSYYCTVPPANIMEQSQRFNLWVVDASGPIRVCYGTLDEMNQIARTAGIAGDVYVLPEGQKPLAMEANGARF